MITDVASYLRFFDSVTRRTARDVAALPSEAAAWRPPAVSGEAGWSIGQIVGRLLKDTPDAWLSRRVEMIDTPGSTLSGWRILMMLVEHEVHHRSQIDAYAGLQGWPVPDIFNRSAEDIAALRAEQLSRHRG